MSSGEGVDSTGMEYVCQYLQFGKEELIFETQLYLTNMIGVGEIEDPDIISEGEVVFGLHVMDSIIPIGLEFLVSILPSFPGTTALLSMFKRVNNSYGIVDLIEYLFSDGNSLTMSVDEISVPKPRD